MSLDMYKEDLDKQSAGSPCYVKDMIFDVVRVGTKEAIEQIQDIRIKLYGVFPNPKEVNDHEIMANWLAHHGVKGWENVLDEEDGKKLEFTKSFARQLFLNKSYWMSLNQILIIHANNYENYLNDEAYEDAEQIKKP